MGPFVIPLILNFFAVTNQREGSGVIERACRNRKTMTSVDVSTYSIAESVCSAMNGRVAFEDVLAVWHAIGE